MHTDRETTRIVRSWLDQGATALPDHVLDAVLDQVPTTPQRRSSWPPRRVSDMNSALKAAIALAAVVAVAFVGYNLMPRSGGIGGTPTTAPTIAPTPSPIPVPTAPRGSLDAGTYRIDDPSLTAVPFTFTVPDGWVSREHAVINKGQDTPGEVSFYPFNVTHIYSDACTSDGVLAAIGPTPDDLVQALVDQGGSDASTPVDVTVGGYPATRIDMSIPAALDLGTCRHAPDLLLQIWADEAEESFFAIPAERRDQVFPVYIVDVDGTRAVFLPSQQAEATAADIAELESVLASITFVP